MVGRKWATWAIISLIVVSFNIPAWSSQVTDAAEKYSYIAITLATDQGNDLYLLTANGQTWVNLTRGTMSAGRSAWSPDGSRIAFVGGQDDHVYVYLVYVRNDETQRLTEENSINFRPTWSLDGTRIAFTAYRSGLWGIRVIDVKGESDSVWLIEGDSAPSFLCWGPDNDHILYNPEESGEFFVLNIEDGTSYNITGFTPENEYEPSWSPDGQKIAFVVGEPGRIAVMRADGSERRFLLPQFADAPFPVLERTPTWSPDGKHIAFTSNRMQESTFDLYVVNADGTELTQLTHVPIGSHIYAPAWSPWLDEPLDLDWQPTPWSVSEE